MTVAFWTLLASMLVGSFGLMLMSGDDIRVRNFIGRWVLTFGMLGMWVAFMSVNIFTPSFIFALSVVLLFFAGVFHTKEFQPATF